MPRGVSTVLIAGVALLISCAPRSAIDSAPAAGSPETATPLPTKFAIAVQSPTPTPSRPPTTTPRPTATPTSQPTRAKTPTAISTRKAPVVTTAAPTPSPATTPVNVGETYGTLAVYPSPSDHSGALVEVNLAARGFAPGSGVLGLVNIDGPTDAGAPQLSSLFGDARTPTFSRVFQIYGWDWSCDCAAAPLAEPPVTLAGLTVAPGEILRVPRSSYYVGNDYQALVLYADSERIAFNYTRTGNPVRGYTIYLEGIAVDSSLLALYQQMDAAGRAELPALQAGQGIGTAQTSELKIAIRDAGAFMDPRSRKDWWRGK